MRTRLWTFAALLAGAAALAGCNNKEKDQISVLEDQNAKLQQELDQSKSALEGADAARRAAEEEAARQRQAAEAAAAGGAPAAGDSQPKMPDLPPGVTARAEGNQLVIDIPGDVLFDSGKATLKESAKKTLDQLAKVVKERYPGKKIAVAGFTDSDPIKKSKWEDNWQLAFARARAVGKYLSGKGFSESQFRYVSFGATDPKGSKKESRRVELAVIEAF